MKINRFPLLAAGLLLAMAVTLSCSDDKDDVGWLTCPEIQKLSDQCYSLYKDEYQICSDACNDDIYGTMYDACIETCENSVGSKMEKCEMDGACNGTSIEVCMQHYEHMECVVER